jgi:hypothetical protein
MLVEHGVVAALDRLAALHAALPDLHKEGMIADTIEAAGRQQSFVMHYDLHIVVQAGPTQ